MKTVITNDKAAIEQMMFMAERYDATINVEDLGDGRFQLTMSDEDVTKMPSAND